MADTLVSFFCESGELSSPNTFRLDSVFEQSRGWCVGIAPLLSKLKNKASRSDSRPPPPPARHSTDCLPALGVEGFAKKKHVVSNLPRFFREISAKRFCLYLRPIPTCEPRRWPGRSGR